MLKTTDSALTGACAKALLQRVDRGERVDPVSYYFRINPAVETASRGYDCLNRVPGIGVGDAKLMVRSTAYSRICKVSSLLLNVIFSTAYQIGMSKTPWIVKPEPARL
jgi:hypothetical protein